LTDDGPEVNRRGVGLMSAAHVVDDLYQGVVPALLPFFVLERHYSYAAVAGLTLAATVLSSVAQPFFGWWTDRRPRRWMIPAGIVTAGIGVGLAGLAAAPPAATNAAPTPTTPMTTMARIFSLMNVSRVGSPSGAACGRPTPYLAPAV